MMIPSLQDDARCAKAIEVLCSRLGVTSQGHRREEVLALREAYIYCISLPQFPGRFAVKLFRHRQARQQAKAQAAFDLLRTLYPRNNERLAVPRPYTAIPKRAAVITEWVEGRQLSGVLRRQDGKARSLTLRQAGEWLRWFHEGTVQERVPYDHGRALARIDRLSRHLRKNESRYLAAHRELLEHASRYFSSLRLPYARLHADFTPLNLLFDGVRMIGVDFTHPVNGPVSDDICRFLVYADIYQFWLTRASSLRRYGCRRSDHEAFVAGYGPLALSENEFLYLQYTEIVRRLASLSLLSHKRGISLLRWLELFRLRRIARHAAVGLRGVICK